MTDGKAEVGKVGKRKSEKKEDQRRERKKQADQSAQKGRKAAKHPVFPMIWGSGGLRSIGSPTRRVQSHLARWDIKNCTLLWHEAHFEGKSSKAPRSQSTFGRWDVEKARGTVTVGRSTCGSQNEPSTSVSVCFWELWEFQVSSSHES